MEVRTVEILRDGFQAPYKNVKWFKSSYFGKQYINLRRDCFVFFEDILNLILFVISDNLWGEFQSVVADSARVVNVGVVNRS